MWQVESTPPDHKMLLSPLRPPEDEELLWEEAEAARTLRRGDRGAAARRLQAALTAAGHPLAVRARWVAYGRGGARALQARRGLAVDGVGRTGGGLRAWRKATPDRR